MNPTRIFTWKIKLMALAIGLMASLTVTHFTGLGAKTAQFTSAFIGRMNGASLGLPFPAMVASEVPVSLKEGFTPLPPAQTPSASGCGANFAQVSGLSVGVGIHPDSVAVGDFNLDGKPDIASANEFSNNVTILLGNGSGSFTQAAGSPVSAGTSPEYVAAGDFNLDGKPDLAVANIGSANVTILLGNGAGGFTQAAGSPVSAGSFPGSVAVGDFNLDGKPDLAVANFSSTTVTILLGDGGGGFTQPAGSPISVGNEPRSVAAGDLNLDGKLDLAVTTFNSRVTILLGNGSGGFMQAAGSPVFAGLNPAFVAIGDFNLDARPDLAVANASSNNVTILLGNGTGGFTQAVGSPVGAGFSPFSIAVGDFNLDGKPDLAVANRDSIYLTILIGNGNGGFVQAAGSSNFGGPGPRFVAVGDFNLDGKPDLAAASYYFDSVTIHLNTCDAQPCGGIAFSQPAGSPVNAGANPIFSAAGDFNLDGKPDLAVANFFSTKVTILLGNGGGSFTPSAGSPVSVGTNPISVAVGDFNSDGKPDLAVANTDSNNVTILLGNGDGSFAQAPDSPFTTGIGPQFIVVGDFNLDGKLDLITTNAVSSDMTILLGNGSGGFVQAAGSPINLEFNPLFATMSDFNLDGKSDLAITNYGSANLTILLGNGSGGFAKAAGSPISVRNNPTSVAAGDFNLDGKPDLAVVNETSPTVTILLGNGGGGFTQPSTSPFILGGSHYSVAATDFNLDGKPDLAVTQTSLNKVAILLGNGSGDFTLASGSPVGIGIHPFSIAIGDFNLDGKPDFAVANSDSNNLTILLNTCDAQPCGGIAFSQSAGSPVRVRNGPNAVASGDFNLDGKPDLAVANLISNNVTILLGNGSSSFTQAPGSPVDVGGSPYSVVVGDFNLDGKPDLATANGNSYSVTILLGNGAGGFAQPANSPISPGHFVLSIAIGDFNLDGKPDIAAAGGFFNVTILLGNGNGGFTKSPNSPEAGRLPGSVTVGDFNLDGKPDLAVAGRASDDVTVLLGNGSGGFTQAPGSPVSVGFGPYSVVVSDFNQDGNPDLVLANNGSSNVTILLGNGIGGFTQSAGSPFSTGDHPFSVAVGDFNRDGKLDLALPSAGLDNITILLGNGMGGFTQPSGSPISSGLTPVSVVVADFNLDGRPDIATANRDSRDVTIQLNTCIPNTPPTLSQAPVTRIAGDALVNSQIATVSDAQDARNTLSVKVNGGASATVNGITISNITVDAAAVVKADVVASANATSASFTLRVTDSGGLFAEATLNVTVLGFSVKLTDPAVCLGQGGVVGVTAQVTNPNAAQVTASFTATPDPNLLALPGTCVADVGTCSVDAINNKVNWNGALNAGQTVTISYQAQVADVTPNGAELCVTSTASFNAGPPASVTACTTLNCPTVGPGALPLAASPVSDQKAGSVLVYNLYTSGVTDSNAQNTRIAITNTHPGLSTPVHLFFVDGSSCSVADSYICLTPNQTTTFLASDIDPGTTGYVVAIAVNGDGCPTNFNYLIGEEYVKLTSGHAANLGAEAFSALAGGLPLCDANTSTAVLNFDGISYNRAPRVLAVDNIPSGVDGNDTQLVLNRFGGNLATGAATLGTIFGILYNDTENAQSFSISGSCQLRGSLSNNFPRTTPRFENFIPAGRSGWMKLYSQNDIGILGAAINFNPNAGTQANAFNQGHNLHKLTLSATNSLTIPVFPPGC